MLKIYHNPRCSKSREGLDLLKNFGKDFQVMEYLKEVPSEEEIKEILKILELPAIDLVRKNEAVWKENYRGKKLSEEEIIRAMHEHPKLIERPIVVKDGKAVIGRPPETIKKLLK
ncbi:MAG TPA: arsenate reductase (glutaredoxin) [Flavobacteriaceae bacterium]|nr:arsenate reductase (glutaredoxin) [Flavobacteriaceae bacterium]